MKLFFDTNILLDILDKGRPASKCSSIVLNEAMVRKFEIVVTTQSIIDSYYISLKSGLLREDVDRTMIWFSNNVNVRHITSFDIRSAIQSHHSDLEDASQVACADAEGCDVFLTSDKDLIARGFNTSMLMLTPQQFVDKMRRQ